MKRRNRFLAGLAGTALALAMTATAFGYHGAKEDTVTVAGPSGTLTCNTALTVRATFIRAADGNPLIGESVDWTFSVTPSSADRINTTPTITNSSGVATTTVTLACVAGNRTLTATSGEASGGAVLSITSAGLPRTSTLPGSGPAGELPLGMIFALLAVLAGSAIIVRRVASSPR